MRIWNWHFLCSEKSQKMSGDTSLTWLRSIRSRFRTAQFLSASNYSFPLRSADVADRQPHGSLPAGGGTGRLRVINPLPRSDFQRPELLQHHVCRQPVALKLTRRRPPRQRTAAAGHREQHPVRYVHRPPSRPTVHPRTLVHFHHPTSTFRIHRTLSTVHHPLSIHRPCPPFTDLPQWTVYCLPSTVYR